MTDDYWVPNPGTVERSLTLPSGLTIRFTAEPPEEIHTGLFKKKRQFRQSTFELDKAIVVALLIRIEELETRVSLLEAKR